MRTERTRNLVTAALMAALLSASAWVTIPIGAVPVTLQVFVVVLAALVLRPAWAAASVAVYLLVGAAGLPVFSGGQGGIGVLAGPTGGYLFGFLAGAWIGSVVRSRLAPYLGAVADVFGASVLIIVVYGLGMLQLAAVTGMSLGEAMLAGVAPFILPDAMKAAVAATVAVALRRAGVVATTPALGTE